MKKILTMVLLGLMIQPLISFADYWEDELRNIDTNTSNTNVNVNKVLKQLQDDAAAREADDRQARADAAKALDGVSDAEKNAIAKAEKDRKAAEKAAKDSPYVIEVPAGTVMPDDALATYQGTKAAEKKAHDDARATERSTAKKNAATRITARTQAMQDKAKAREDAYQAAVKKAAEEKRPVRPAPKFYN